jgi:hypothetical protein
VFDAKTNKTVQAPARFHFVTAYYGSPDWNVRGDIVASVIEVRNYFVFKSLMAAVPTRRDRYKKIHPIRCLKRDSSFAQQQTNMALHTWHKNRWLFQVTDEFKDLDAIFFHEMVECVDLMNYTRYNLKQSLGQSMVAIILLMSVLFFSSLDMSQLFPVVWVRKILNHYLNHNEFIFCWSMFYLSGGR